VVETYRILIAASDSESLAALEAAVAAAGHQVVGRAFDADEALQIARAVDPDLILLDLDGPTLEAAAVVQGMAKYRPIPSLLLAGNPAQLDNAQTGPEVYGCLGKPVERHLLGAEISVVMARFRQVRLLEERVRRLEEALETRKLVDRAKGVLMQELGLSEEEAHRHLQQESRRRHRHLLDTARSVLARESPLLAKRGREVPA